MQTFYEYEQQRRADRNAGQRERYAANPQRQIEKVKAYQQAIKTTRAQRREQTRNAVEQLITNGLTRHSVKQMVQVAFEANGGKGDAGARVLG